MKLTALCLATVLIAVGNAGSAGRASAQGLDLTEQILTGLRASTYLATYSAQLKDYLDGSVATPPEFDDAQAAGAPHCDSYYDCGSTPPYPPLPTDPAPVPIITPPPYYERSGNVRENDILAKEGIGWFSRSQNHVKLKFELAFDALTNSLTSEAQQFKKAGCDQYSESQTALASTRFASSLQPEGHVSKALLDRMDSALRAVRTTVCGQ